MNKKRVKQKNVILHITPHLGGGVGSVLLNYLKNVKSSLEFSHRVISLEYVNKKSLLASQTNGFLLRDRMSENPEGILSAINEADIVLIHWWNHPLLYAFLVREILPPCRVIFWSHIAGFHAPYVFNKPALQYPDLFVFTSPISFEVPEVKNLEDKWEKNLRVIWSTGGIEHVESIQLRPHKKFNIGYIGTVDYSKMHPEFLKMSNMVSIPDARFIVCGGPSEKQIREEAMCYNMGERIIFTGHVDNIAIYLSEFDVFGYPLAPYHWGTCEQSLCESMAAGIPPVVMANRAERYIVEDGFNGIVARDERTYVNAIEMLYRNSELRLRLSCNARQSAKRRFSSDKMVSQWDSVFNELLTLPKSIRRWTGRHYGKDVSPVNIFLESLGDHGKEFLFSLNAKTRANKEKAKEDIKALCTSSYHWKAATKGTPQHYYSFFPEDDYLKFWSELLQS